MALRLSPEPLARRSARRPWTTIGVWAVVLVIAVVLIGTLCNDALTTNFAFTNTPESQRGVDLLEDLRGVPNSTNEVVIVQSDTLTVDDTEFQEFVVGTPDDPDAGLLSSEIPVMSMYGHRVKTKIADQADLLVFFREVGPLRA